MNKLTKTTTSIILASSISIGAYKADTALNEHNNDQTIVHYMYSTNEGSYVLDTNSDYENVIFIDKKKAEQVGIYNGHHGTKLMATFENDNFTLKSIEMYK